MILESSGVHSGALAGEVAVVTGAGGGIGRAVAKTLAELGATVCVADISESGAETVASIHTAGGTASFIQTDVADPVGMEDMAEQIFGTFGKVDILVNNAAGLTVKSLLEHSLDEWERVLDVNLRGAFLGIQLFLPGMLERRHGIVVTMESAEGMPYLAPYLATKAALRSLAISLAHEVGEASGVSVYCFGPGIVETDGLMQAFRELAPRYGMPFETFLEESGLPLISPELCAAGFTGTILHARHFHGQETTYVEGLAKLGLDASGARAAGSTVAGPGAPDVDAHLQLEPAARPATATADTLEEILTLNRELAEIVRAYAAEFDTLNMLMRPVAKRMFKQDTGLSIEDWGLLTRDMTEAFASGTSDLRIGEYATRLTRLARHIGKQEAQIPGWIKNPDDLDAALEALRHRRGTAERLVTLLRQAQI